MNCQALIDRFLYDYHAGTLPISRRVEFELHLTLCRDCRRYVDSYKKTVNLAKETASELPDQPPAELVQAIITLSRKPS